MTLRSYDSELARARRQHNAKTQESTAATLAFARLQDSIGISTMLRCMPRIRPTLSTKQGAYYPGTDHRYCFRLTLR